MQACSCTYYQNTAPLSWGTCLLSMPPHHRDHSAGAACGSGTAESSSDALRWEPTSTPEALQALLSLQAAGTPTRAGANFCDNPDPPPRSSQDSMSCLDSAISYQPTVQQAATRPEGSFPLPKHTSSETLPEAQGLKGAKHTLSATSFTEPCATATQNLGL